MAIINKRSSGALTGNTLIYTGPCWYYGFVCVTGGSNRTVVLYDEVSATGTAVENFACDANKTTDGHSHAIPVYCTTGLYLALSGGTAVVYYKSAAMG